ncbi:MAG: translation initiation factor IF-6 [Thermoprotei archaeon]|nr:MAG: translation initiation factor IF-6 [Thermoprotei archaeon]RLE98309.1 MAG: translation initiation factor IF-6 [Thermoprotei archaeon]
MSVEVLYAFGNPNIGVYVAISDRVALIPADAPEKVERALSKNLGVRVVRASVQDSPLLGVLCAMNSHGMIVGRLVRERELELLKRVLGDEMNIEVLDVKETALGNLVLVNDKGAVVSPLLPRHAVSRISDALDVEAVQMRLGGSYLVGALGVATNKGVLLCPLASDEEVEQVIDVLKVSKGGVGTVNRGNVFVRSGLVANSRGALVGFETTGPELMRIQSTLF